MFSHLFAAYPWGIRKGKELPDEFTRLLSDPELNGDALGGQVHWSILLRPIAITLGLIAVPVAVAALGGGQIPVFNAIAGAVILCAPLYLIYHLILWRLDLIFITGKRVITLTGILTRQVSMLPLGKLTDMSYTRTPLGRILGYGEFRMETAGQVQAVEKLKRIPDPDFSYRHVQNLLFGRGTTDVILLDVKTDKKVNVKWDGELSPGTNNQPTRIRQTEGKPWHED